MSNAGQDQVTAALQRAGWTQEQGLKAFTVMGNEMGAVLATGKPVTQRDFQNVTAALVSHNVMPASDGAQLIAHAATMSPDQLDSTFRQYYAAAQHGAAMLAPNVNMVNNGAYQIPYNTNQFSSQPIGPMAGATSIQNQLSPTTLAGQVPGVNALGQPTVNSLGNVLAMEHGGTPQASPFPPAVLAQAGQIANQGGPGKNQAAGDAFLQSYASSHGISMQAPALAPGAPNGGVVTGLAPGVAEAASAQGKQAGEGGAALINDMATLPQQRAALQQVASEINSANPGPLNDQLTKISGVLTQMRVINGDQPTAAQLMHKASMLATISTASTNMGVPTDSKMAAVMAATPNATMTPEAARTATGMLMGLVDYKQAKGAAWQQYQAAHGPQSFQQFQVEWNKSVPNAAAFQFNHLPAAEQTKYWSSLDKASKQQVLEAMHAVGIQPVKNGR